MEYVIILTGVWVAFGALAIRILKESLKQNHIDTHGSLIGYKESSEPANDFYFFGLMALVAILLALTSYGYRVVLSAKEE
jgi:hypothetical protein